MGRTRFLPSARIPRSGSKMLSSFSLSFFSIRIPREINASFRILSIVSLFILSNHRSREMLSSLLIRNQYRSKFYQFPRSLKIFSIPMFVSNPTIIQYFFFSSIRASSREMQHFINSNFIDFIILSFYIRKILKNF